MSVPNKLNENYSCDTTTNVTVSATLGAGQIGPIDLYVGGVFVDTADGIFSHDFGKGSDLIGKTAAFHITASQPIASNTMTNVQYSFSGGASAKVYKNSQTLTGGDTTTIYTDQFNFVK